MREYVVPDGVEIVARDLRVPWAIDWPPDNRLIFSERIGKVSEVTPTGPREMLNLNVFQREGYEGGLLGLAVSPDYEQTNSIYIYYTYTDSDGQPHNRISAFIEESHRLGSEKIILNGLPGGNLHNGGRIKFGPDGKLYITVGETWHRDLAQRLDSLGGKILRLNPDGSVPTDNPFTGSPIWSYGNRNPQGLAWHPVTRALFSSEHGPSGEKAWFAHDKVNIIEPGRNYGWPHVIGYTKNPRFVSPIYSTGYTTWAPSGCAFVTSQRYPELQGKLLVANLRGISLAAITLKAPEYRVARTSSFSTRGNSVDFERWRRGLMATSTSAQATGTAEGAPAPRTT